MNGADGQGGWPPAVVLLHWVAGLLALAVAMLGVFLLSPPDWSQPYVDRYMAWIGWHKLGGLVVLPLAAAWLAVRIRTPRPPRPDGERTQRAARIAHAVLFALLVALPLSGYLMDSLINPRLDLPGGWRLPSPLPRDDGLSIILSYLHKWGGFGLLGIAALHLAAALWHAARANDRTLAAMLPGLRRSRKSR